VIPGEIEVIQSSSLIIIHYPLNLDVLDSQLQILSSRSISKQLRLVLHSPEVLMDVQDFLDLPIDRHPLLVDIRRSQLSGAVSELRRQPSSMSDSLQLLTRVPAHRPTEGSLGR
jgi:hypothetical protein